MFLYDLPGMPWVGSRPSVGHRSDGHDELAAGVGEPPRRCLFFRYILPFLLMFLKKIYQHGTVAGNEALEVQWH
jgi:hypothetical protein